MAFAGGTLIWTSIGERTIESLKAGDEVVTHEGIGTVTAAMKAGLQPVIVLTLSTGRTISCTPDHRLGNGSSGFAAARLLSARTLDAVGGTVTVSSISALTDPVHTYRLTTSDGSYFANGVLAED